MIFRSDSFEWKMVWSDEFSTDGYPDPRKWTYETGFVRNEEEQYYRADTLKNARVEQGKLIIEAHKENLPNPHFKPSSEHWREKRPNIKYSSASLTTLGKAQWTYGRFEVRAKLPAGKGVWPAIWMLGLNKKEHPWPACGEIDIMEYLGRKPGLIYGTAHYMQDQVHIKNIREFSVTPPPTDAFHVYALEWSPETMEFYVDTTLYHTVDIPVITENGYNPFYLPKYLLINLALGGSWGESIDRAAIPARYEIDYVRIYQKKRKYF